jgi:DNA polymerase-3 subunit gamma/tau
MLKTLEEPPEHLKFILATTDPQKIPVTVLSRCLQFNLKQMPPAAIAEHLQRLLEAEKIACEPEALPLIARAAAGSMRDALSLLDQAIAHGAGSIAAGNVRDMLGAVDTSYLLRLLEAVAARDGAQLMAIADEMQSRSLSFDAALQDLAGLLLKLAMAHAVPEALDAGLPERDRLLGLAGRFDPENVQLCYQIALQGREDLPLAPDEHAGFVMTVLRMLAFRPEGAAPALAGADNPASAPPPPAGSNATRAQPFGGDWPDLVRRLQVTGAARELARNSAVARHADGVIELVVPKSMSHLAERNYQEKLKAALEQHFGRQIVLKVTPGEAAAATAAAIEAEDREARRADAARAVQGDRFVKDLVDMFDAKVVGSSVRANGDKN